MAERSGNPLLDKPGLPLIKGVETLRQARPLMLSGVCNPILSGPEEPRWPSLLFTCKSVSIPEIGLRRRTESCGSDARFLARMLALGDKLECWIRSAPLACSIGGETRSGSLQVDCAFDTPVFDDDGLFFCGGGWIPTAFSFSGRCSNSSFPQCQLQRFLPINLYTYS